MLKKFLVVVDTQYDFVMPDGALYVGGAEEIIVPGIDFLSKLNPDEYVGVLFTHDTHDRTTYYDLEESKEFPIHCLIDTTGWHNVFNPSLIPDSIPAYRLQKGYFSMWKDQDFRLVVAKQPLQGGCFMSTFKTRDSLFEDLAKDEIVIQVMGVASDYCVKWAVDGLVERGFKVEVIGNLCRGIGAPASDVFEGPDYLDVAIV